MPLLPSNWKSDFLPYVGKSFDYYSKIALKEDRLIQLFSEINTNSAYYDMRGSGDFSELPDYDGTMKRINPLRGFATQFAPAEKMGVYDIHYKAWKNDMSGELKKSGKQLADSAAQTISNSALRMFARAFSSSYLGGDGKAWAATDHPNASKGTTAGSRSYEADSDAGTYSNLFTTELSTKAIDAMRDAALRFVTPSGNPFKADYTLLLVAPELRATALKLLGMNAELRPKKDPDSAENAASSIADMKFMVCGAGNKAHGLGFKDKQFAICDPTLMKEMCAIVYNTKPEVEEAMNVNPKIKTYVAYCDYAVGFAEARQILFANPA